MKKQLIELRKTLLFASKCIRQYNDQMAADEVIENGLSLVNLMLEAIEIKTSENINTLTINQIEKLINDFKNEELPDADTPFHYEKEIAAGFKDFVKWLKKRDINIFQP